MRFRCHFLWFFLPPSITDLNLSRKATYFRFYSSFQWEVENCLRPVWTDSRLYTTFLGRKTQGFTLLRVTEGVDPFWESVEEQSLKGSMGRGGFNNIKNIINREEYIIKAGWFKCDRPHRGLESTVSCLWGLSVGRNLSKGEILTNMNGMFALHFSIVV